MGLPISFSVQMGNVRTVSLGFSGWHRWAHIWYIVVIEEQKTEKRQANFRVLYQDGVKQLTFWCGTSSGEVHKMIGISAQNSYCSNPQNKFSFHHNRISLYFCETSAKLEGRISKSRSQQRMQLNWGIANKTLILVWREKGQPTILKHLGL